MRKIYRAGDISIVPPVYNLIENEIFLCLSTKHGYENCFQMERLNAYRT